MKALVEASRQSTHPELAEGVVVTLHTDLSVDAGGCNVDDSEVGASGREPGGR